VTTNLFCGAAASPLAVGKRIVIQTGSDLRGGRILALNAASGATEWEWQGPGPGYASPLLVKLPGSEQIVTLTEASVIGLEAGTGRQLWSTPFPDQWHENIATPVWTGSCLIVSGTRQGTHAYSITRTNGTWQALPVWKSKEVAMYMSTPVIGDGVIYAHSAKKSGQLVAFEPETGAIKWATDGRAGDHGALLLTPRNLLWLTKEGKLSVVRRSAMEFQMDRSYTVAETETWAIPVPLGNDLLVRDASNLIRLKPRQPASH
jgi:outer membrane protein assembly factor BamB